MALPQSKPPVAFRKHVLALLDENYGDKTLVLCPTAFVTLLDGDHKAAILLAQILYWADRTKDPDGWFYKSYADWQIETGLSEAQVRRIVNGDPRVQSAQITLHDLGVETIIKKVKHTGAPTLHYRINQTQFLAALEQLLGQGDSQQSEESIPHNAQNECSTLPGMNSNQSEASFDLDSKTSSEISLEDHDHQNPTHHSDEDSDLEIFFSFEVRFGLLKQSAKTPLRKELLRLGVDRVGIVLERCATRGRSWLYVVKSLANEKTASSEPSTTTLWAEFASTDIEVGQKLLAEPQEALLATERVQTPWSGSVKLNGTVQDAWAAVLHQLQAQLGSSFYPWGPGLVLVDFEPQSSTFVIIAMTPYARDLLQTRFSRIVRRILCDVYGEPADLHFLIREDWEAFQAATEITNVA